MPNNNKKTFDDLIDIVSYPDHIKNYSSETDDYLNLAINAIKNKPSTIKYISPTFKDYTYLCEIAVKEDIKAIEYINYEVSNYKELGTIAINKSPFVISILNPQSKYYLYFWELAISLNEKVLLRISNNNKNLFSLLIKTINTNPLAIQYIDSHISIYNQLCHIAYKLDNDAINYMDINMIDKELVFTLLNTNLKYYKEAWELVIDINPHIIEYLNYYYIYHNLDDSLVLIQKASEKDSNMTKYHSIIYALCLNNRRIKEKIQSNPSKYGKNISKLLADLDKGYNQLLNDYKNLKQNDNASTIVLK